MNPVLEVRDITRRFDRLLAVDRVSFAVRPGEVAGFIGPNGAGKTTTMRICATLDLPDEGDVLLGGRSVLADPRGARARLGFMPDAYGAYANTTVADYLDFFARAYGLGRARHATIRNLVDFTALGDLLGKPMSALSKGMKQRLCLAKTLLHDPDLLILDEPAAGLDPRARIEFRELVLALRGTGKAILVSSHILSELGEMCDSVIVIERGIVRAAGSMEDISAGLRAERKQVFVRALAGPEALLRALQEEPHVGTSRTEGSGCSLTFQGDETALARLVESLVRRGLAPVEVTPEKVDLEDVFLSVTEGRVQ